MKSEWILSVRLIKAILMLRYQTFLVLNIIVFKICKVYSNENREQKNKTGHRPQKLNVEQREIL